jgi:short-subunit dehydrogenase
MPKSPHLDRWVENRPRAATEGRTPNEDRALSFAHRARSLAPSALATGWKPESTKAASLGRRARGKARFQIELLPSVVFTPIAKKPWSTRGRASIVRLPLLAILTWRAVANTTRMMELQGKVVVVTGASRGIGESIAKVFADEGASVVLLSRDSSRAEAARVRIGHSERTIALACDVRHVEEIDRVIALTLHHFQHIDVWVNNAGHGLLDSVSQLDMAACHDLFETNFFGAVAGMQAAIRVMQQQGGGAIINISSVAGHIPLPFHAAYSATKFALNAIGKGAGVELKNRGIRVLTVCPGYVQTAFGQNAVRGKELKQVRPTSVRGVSPERVARATLNGYLKQKREVIVPWTMHIPVKLYQLFPGLVEWGMRRMAG